MFRQNRAQRLWRLGAFSRRLWNSPASGLPGIGEPGWRAEKAAQVRTSLPTSRTAPPPKATARQPLQSSVLFLIRRGRAFQCKLSGYGAMFSSLFRQELRNKRHPPAFWAPVLLRANDAVANSHACVPARWRGCWPAQRGSGAAPWPVGTGMQPARCGR